MDKIEKFLKKIPEKINKEIHRIVDSIVNGKTEDLDCKKLRGKGNIFRVRKGDVRILYAFENGKNIIISIEKRSDNTYNF